MRRSEQSPGPHAVAAVVARGPYEPRKLPLPAQTRCVDCGGYATRCLPVSAHGDGQWRCAACQVAFLGVVAERQEAEASALHQKSKRKGTLSKCPV